MRIRIALVLALIVILSGLPASEPAPPVAPQPWAEEALQWFRALDEAGRLGTANLLRFLAPDVVHDNAFEARVAVGRSEYAAHMEHLDEVPVDEPGATTVYLDAHGALVAHRRTAFSLDDYFTALEIDANGMIAHESELEYAWEWSFREDSTYTAIRAVADAYLRGLASSDPSAIRPIYAPNAALVDSMQLVELTGVAAIGRHAEDHPLTASMDEDADAVSFRFLHDSWVRPDELLVLIPYSWVDGSGCRGHAAAALHVSSGLIVQERRYHAIDSVRRCWDPDQRPDGWWTGLRPPAPFDDVVTGTVRAEGQLIEIHNGSPALERLVRWAVQRFEAHLSPLSLQSVTFEQGMEAPQCTDDRTGITVDVGGSTQVYICLAEDDACAGDGCTTFQASARLLLLHELAHTWMLRHVDEAAQRSFMDHMGVAEWSSLEVAWHDRGVEQAAQVIAWGLMDEPIELSRLDHTCEELADAYRLLTGGDPPREACPHPG